MTADVTVFGNVPLTSRILNSATNASEALLLIDDPPASQQVLNTNVFQGIVDGPDIVFSAVPIPSGGPQSLRIVNLRADAHAFGLGTASAQPDFVGVTLSGISVTMACKLWALFSRLSSKLRLCIRPTISAASA